MNPMQSAVHDFLLKHLGDSGDGWPNKTGIYNKFLLVAEEFEELADALGISRVEWEDDPGEHGWQSTRTPDAPQTVDAICDLLYVIFNLCEELKLDIQPFFDEVHRSNMTKMPAALSPNMKVQKGPDYDPPRIAEMLENYRRNQRHLTSQGLPSLGILAAGVGDGKPI